MLSGYDKTVPVAGPGGTGASAYQTWLTRPGNAGRSEDDFLASLGVAGAVSPNDLALALATKLDLGGDAGASLVRGRRLDAIRQVIDVRDAPWNVCGDGTDEAPKLTAALAAAARVATVWIPPTLSLVVSQVPVPSGTHLILDGTLTRKAGTLGHVLSMDGTAQAPVTDVLIEGRGTVDGNRATPNGVCGIYGDLCQRIEIRGIGITGCAAWPVSLVRTDKALLVDLTSSYCGNSFQFASNSTLCWAVRCEAHHIDDHGIAFYGGIEGGGALNCHCHHNGGSGIVVLADGDGSGPQPTNGPCLGLLILGNICEYNTANGIDVHTDGPATAIHRYITVGQNTLRRNSQGNGGYGGLYLASLAFSRVSGNVSRENGNGPAQANGYRIAGFCLSLTLDGCESYDEGQGGALGVGLQVDPTAFALVVRGFKGWDTQATQTMAYGINGALNGGTLGRFVDCVPGPVIGDWLHLTKASDTFVSIVAEPALALRALAGLGDAPAVAKGAGLGGGSPNAYCEAGSTDLAGRLIVATDQAGTPDAPLATILWTAARTKPARVALYPANAAAAALGAGAPYADSPSADRTVVAVGAVGLPAQTVLIWNYLAIQ